MSNKLPPTGTYRIISVVNHPRQGTGIFGELLAGIDFNVHNNADYTALAWMRYSSHWLKWKITQKPEDPSAYRFALKDIRPFTGIQDRDGVIVTEKADEDRERRLKHYEEHDAYSIQLSYFAPVPAGWTLASEDPSSKILIKPFDVPSRLQLFKFVKVGGE